MTPVIELVEARKHYPVRNTGWFGKPRQFVKAVDGVSFSLQRGRTLGIVGESGCGKSTMLRLVLGIESATAGHINFDGQALAELPPAEARRYRRSVQAVFQDPWSSLNPRMRIGDIVAEPLLVNGLARRSDVMRVAGDLLQRVGLQPAHAMRFPHEFSGGQRQRIAIARALSLSPDVIVLDEPVSALDVSIRAQIINLLKDLQEARGMGYLFVAHQLSSVWSISDDVAVMYLGRIVEQAPVNAVRSEPLHPYTQALLGAALPRHPRDRRAHAGLVGEVPSPIDPPSGCAFHPRCPMAVDRCRAETPKLQAVATGRIVACHLY